MAYSRYGASDWYIFWEVRAGHVVQRKEDEVLAVWHMDHRSAGPSFTWAQVSEMLSTHDFSRVPGFTEDSREFLEEIFREFIDDINAEYAGRKKQQI